MQSKTVSDYLQNELTLKKINQIYKEKIKSLEFENAHLKHMIKQTNHVNGHIKNNNSISNFTKQHYSILALGSVFVFGMVMPLNIDIFDGIQVQNNSAEPTKLKSKYVIENLRGDVIETNAYWKWAKNTPINVSVLNSELVGNEKFNAIKKAITSIETITLDDSLMHKGPKGSTSVYYDGWQGAVNQLDQNTLYKPPVQFNIFRSSISEGNIVLVLETASNPDGYSGFTKNIVDNNEILKSYVTIYGVGSLSESQLSTIVKHEFGHVLGLAHSTDPNDLMHPVIATNFPIISECNVDALESLYNGNIESAVVCRK